MITLKNNNCGFGLTTIQFAGHDELDHCAIYLAARGGNPKWDKPYFEDSDSALEWLEANINKPFLCVQFCMGGGSVPEYEHIDILFS